MAKEQLKHKRCIHMPTKENTVVIFTSKSGNKYDVGFTIGNQDFTTNADETKEMAEFYCDMLEIAFKNLVTPKSFDNFKSEEAKELAFKACYPSITVLNLR